MSSFLSADVRSFTNEFTNLLNVLKTRSKFVSMCRDYNTDLLKMQTKGEFGLFYEYLKSTGFASKVTLPTKFCDTTSTLIDNVYSNVLDLSGVTSVNDLCVFLCLYIIYIVFTMSIMCM